MVFQLRGISFRNSVGGNEFQGAQEADSGLDLLIRQFLIRCVRIRGEDELHRVALIQGEDAGEVLITACFPGDQQLCTGGCFRLGELHFILPMPDRPGS